MAKKPSLGRQKIKIARIEKPNHRQVTFSKRRSGLFKKACELCTLCGVEIMIVVFSPASKVFSFGHPDVDSLVDRFLMTRSQHQMMGSGSASTSSSSNANANASVRELNAQLTHINAMLEVEKERKEALEKASEAAGRGQNWWEGPLDKLGRGQLEQLASSLEDLKKSVFLQVKAVTEASATSSSAPGVRMLDNRFDGKQTMAPDQELAGMGFDNGFGNFAGHHNGFGSF